MKFSMSLLFRLVITKSQHFVREKKDLTESCKMLFLLFNLFLAVYLICLTETHLVLLLFSLLKSFDSDNRPTDWLSQ